MHGFECPAIRPLTNRLRLFCSMLDEALGPSLRPGHIIEIAGEAGSGKTQFGLHLSARSVVDASGNELSKSGASKNYIKQIDRRKTLYISTEGPFPIGRLRQMIEGMGEPKSLMDNIFIENITSMVSKTCVLNTYSGFEG